jgi:hypothetical protein
MAENTTTWLNRKMTSIPKTDNTHILGCAACSTPVSTAFSKTSNYQMTELRQRLNELVLQYPIPVQERGWEGCAHSPSRRCTTPEKPIFRKCSKHHLCRSSRVRGMPATPAKRSSFRGDQTPEEKKREHFPFPSIGMCYCPPLDYTSISPFQALGFVTVPILTPSRRVFHTNTENHLQMGSN